MADPKEAEQTLNDGLKDFVNNIGKTMENADAMLKNLMPQSPAKIIEIEFDGKKCNASAYISMNNVLCIDFSDKIDMKKYFDSLK